MIQAFRHKFLETFCLMIVLALAAVFFHGKSDLVHIKAFDSAAHARVALNMTQGFPSGHYAPVLPVPLSLETGDWNEHPFPLFFLTGAWARMWGVSTQSLRFLPGLLFPLLCVFWTFRLGARIGKTPLAGFLAAVILTFSPYFTRGGNGFQLDPAVTFFILLSFEFALKNRVVGTALAAAAGIGFKHPIALLVYPALVLSGTGYELKRPVTVLKWVGSGIAALALGLGVWALANSFSEMNLASDYLGRQLFGTAVKGRGVHYETGFRFFLKILATKWEPWFLVLVATILHSFKNKTRFFAQFPQARLILSATLIVYAFMSLIAFRFEHYYYSMYPMMAILIGVYWSPRLIPHQDKTLKSFAVFGVVFLTVFSTTSMLFSQERYPELRGLMPYFTRFGDCRGEFWAIEGEYSRGGAQEHRIEVTLHANFQKTRVFQSVADMPAISPSLQWILIPTKQVPASWTYPKIHAGNLTAFYLGQDWDPEYRPTLADQLKIRTDCL